MMKRFLQGILLILFMLLMQSIFFGQINQDWKWVHPAPQGNTLKYIKTISPTEWILAGYNGTYMHTSNAGTSWSIYTNAGGVTTSGLFRSLYDGWFFNANTGIVCGANGYIARTTNSGLSWDTSSSGMSVTLNGMHFINSTTGFIGCADNVLKTTNGGLTWTAVPLGVTASVNNIFALDANHIYAPSSSGNLYVTTNGGINWVKDSTGTGTLNDVNFIDANTGFVCGSSLVRVTTNGGVNWTNVPTGVAATYNSIYVTTSSSPAGFSENFDAPTFPPTGWRAVNVLGSSIVWVRSVAHSHSAPASAYIMYDMDTANGGGLDWLITPQITINSGDSLSFWIMPEYAGYPPDSLCIRVSTTDTALLSFTTRVLYLAEGVNYPDSGQWGRYAVSLNSFAGQNIYIGFKNQNINGDGIFLDDVHIGPSTSSSAATVYVVGDTSRIFRTDNLGTNWTAVPILDPAHKWTNTWNAMDINGSTMVTAGLNGAINVSTNNGANWLELYTKISAGTMYDVWCEYGTGKVWVVGAPGKTGAFDQVLYSANGGITFTNQNVGNSIATYRSICMVDAMTGYICGTLGAVRKTVNGGTSWDSLVTPIPNTFTLSKIDFVNANTGWVFANAFDITGTIWGTTDGGVNWMKQVLSDTLPNGPRVYSADMVNENLGFCSNGYSALHMTTNGGVNWVLKVTPMFYGPTVNEICMVSDTSGYLVGSGKLFKTTNQWQTYDSVPLPIPGTLISTKWLDFRNGFVVNSSGLTIKTTDTGGEWEILPTSASGLNKIFAKTIDTAYVVGTNGNVFKSQKGPVGITWKNEVPVQYYLGQNYPNPFNPETQFKFGLSAKSKVNLKIYDITGRLVQTYFDNITLNAGTVTVKFNGTNLASGVYFYSLIIDDNRIGTKKMVLVK